MDVNLWDDLKLGQLLGNDHDEQLPLALQEALRSGKKSKERIILDHKKTWKKPSYNVLKDRYGSKPHDPPVLDPNKLTKLADPLRGKFSASYERMLAGGDDDSDEEGNFRGFEAAGGTRKRNPATSSASKKVGTRSSLSPTSGPGGRSSAFFLTAAGSDDEADDSNVYDPTFGASKRRGGGGVSSFRGKLEEAKRNGRGITEKLSRPLFERRQRQPPMQQQQQQQPGMQRKKSGKFATAGAVFGAAGPGKRKAGNVSFTHIKTSIPSQLPPPRRRPASKIFDAGNMWDDSKGGKGRAKVPGGRRGAAPRDMPMGVGLDLSNESSNVVDAGMTSALAERRAQRLARAKVGLTGAARSAQSKDTADLPPAASGGGINAAARIRASRVGPVRGPGGIKSAPGYLSGAANQQLQQPPRVPRAGRVPPLSQKDAVAAAVMELGASTSSDSKPALPPRKKSVTIDPSLSPLIERPRKLSASVSAAGLATYKGSGKGTASVREQSSSPRSKLLNSKSNPDTSYTGPPSPRRRTGPESGLGVVGGIQVLQANLKSIQDKEKERLGAKDAESTGAALLMQHAKRLSSKFEQALAQSARYNEIEDDGQPQDYSVFLGTKAGKVVI